MIYKGEYTLRKKARYDIGAWCALQEIVMNNSNMDYYEAQKHLEKEGCPIPENKPSLFETLGNILNPLNIQ